MTEGPVVADSSCLISLERIGELEVLPALFHPVVVTPEVMREFGVSLPWLGVEAPSNPALVAVLGLLVDTGEAEAIALAQERGWRIILDDRRARAVAVRLGVRIIGTVGVLVRARQRGVVAALRPLLDSLELGGFHISPALRQEALRLAGE